MKDEIFYDILKRLNNVTRDDFDAPVRQMGDRFADQVIQFLEYKFNTTLKNIDVIIDILKVLLTVAGSILIATLSITNFTYNSSLLVCISIVLIIILGFSLIARTMISNLAIKKYNEFLDHEYKSVKETSKIYYDNLRSNSKQIMNDYEAMRGSKKK